MRVGFAGTPDFAATALGAILAAGYEVPVVLTQPDRPKGRGLKSDPSPVKRLAVEHGVPVLQPATLRSAEAQGALFAVPLDVLVVAAYGLILPLTVLAWPRHGCLNIHASKLPRWRGAAPIQRAIAAGDTLTGITIMQMDAGLDTGPMVEWVDVAIAPRETAGTLHDKLASAGSAAIVAVLARLARDKRLASTPQPTTGVTHAGKIDRAEAAIDWSNPAEVVDRQIRAFDPAPGAVTTFEGNGVKVWRAGWAAGTRGAPPGTVLALTKEGIVVACGHGELRIEEMQPASSRRMCASAFAAGHGVVPGKLFGPQSPS
jgi:methionyl-tRNA formyltransferase